MNNSYMHTTFKGYIRYCQPILLHALSSVRGFCTAASTSPYFHGAFSSQMNVHTRDCVLNSRNSHVWADENSHAPHVHGFQQRFSVNVWAGILDGHVIGPYQLPSRLTGPIYLIFLQQVLGVLLDAVPLNVRQDMWFQHDGAPPHFSLHVRELMDRRFEQRWIGRGGPIACPPGSPDLTPLDFFLWVV